MELYRGIAGRQALLPYEVELCNTLGITDKEYFEFVETVAEYARNRGKGYELIPDIQAGPAAGAFALYTATGTLTILGQIVVGVALSAISYLLTPKPKTPEGPPSLTVGGIQGRSRFAPQFDFNSLQELAALGTFVPLVYSKKGVRVNSQLLFSQIKTTGLGEILSVVTLFSHGELGAKPDFESFAIGDSLLENFSERKLALYFNTGLGGINRLNNSHKFADTIAPETNNLGNRGNREYSTNDPFSVKIDKNNNALDYRFSTSTSGTKTSFTQSRFGLFAPMPNGNAFRVPWESILFGLDANDDFKNRQLPHKIRKILNRYPQYCAVVGSQSSGTRINASKGNTFKYRIYGATREAAFIEQPLDQEGIRLYGDSTFFTSRDVRLFQDTEDNTVSRKHNKFAPYGSEDAKSFVDTVRNQADDSIHVGQQYMMGTALVTCTKALDGRQWSPDGHFAKDYEFTVDEPGLIEIQDVDGINNPFETLNLQRVSLALVANTKACQITELGIKSKVYRRINGFPNLNAVPSAEVMLNTEDKNGSISVGGMSKYVTRYSFFKLQGRPQHSTSEFKDICNKYLCIKGDSPVEQYNTISIHHQKGQYEYRLLPVSGNYILSADNPVREAYVLKHSAPILVNNYTNFANPIRVFIHAEPLILPSTSLIASGTTVTNNREWRRFNDDFEDSYVNTGGPITQLDRSNNSYQGGVDPITLSANWSYEDISSPNYPGENFPNVYNPPRGLAVTLHKGAQTWRLTYYTGGITATTLFQANPGTMPTANGQLPTSFTAIGERDGIRRKVEIGSLVSSTATANIYKVSVSVPVSNQLVQTVTTITPSTAAGSGSGATLKVTYYANNSFRSFQIENQGTGYTVGSVLRFTINDGTNNLTTDAMVTSIDQQESGQSQKLAERLANLDQDHLRKMRLQKPYYEETSYNPNNKIADYFLYDAEESSHENNPEHEIVFINEILDSAEGEVSPTYSKLAIAGLRIDSSREFETFNSLSAFIKSGIKILPLSDNSAPYNASSSTTKTSSNNFPEIAYDLLTNQDYGAASTIGVLSVDKTRMALASGYCKANCFEWDGIIDKRFNLREFIFEHAGNNLCDFNILGGQFSLSPGLPIDSNSKKIKFDAVVGGNEIPIRALFTDGNIKDLQVTFLNPEERQMFKAVVIYRKDNENGFPENITKTFSYIESGQSEADREKLPEEVFDFSNWCTSEAHVRIFAGIALATRKLVDHAITFETSPTSVLNLIPGQYVRLVSESTHTNRFDNGIITESGEVISREPITGNPQIYYWKPGSTDEVREASLSSAPNNVLFTVKTTDESDRLYKIESITYGEEGFVKVAATHVPLTSDKKLAILEKIQWQNPNSCELNNNVFEQRFEDMD